MKLETENSAEFWQNRYEEQKTGWDLGDASGPLKYWIDQIEDKNARILIPGCGNAHEAGYLLQKGFTDVHLIDIASAPIERLKFQFKNHSAIKIEQRDFFLLDKQYDVILEQTFFCALHPSLRLKYVEKISDLLADTGYLSGVLFNRNFENDGPPFGGSTEEYFSLFSNGLKVDKLEACHVSHEARLGTEVLFKCSKI